MAVFWKPSTEDDFDRIHLHNSNPKWGDFAKADRIEDRIRADGDALNPNSGTPWTEGGRENERKARSTAGGGYFLFFRVTEAGDIEIFAVAGQTEGYSAWIGTR